MKLKESHSVDSLPKISSHKSLKDMSQEEKRKLKSLLYELANDRGDENADTVDEDLFK